MEFPDHRPAVTGQNSGSTIALVQYCYPNKSSLSRWLGIPTHQFLFFLSLTLLKQCYSKMWFQEPPLPTPAGCGLVGFPLLFNWQLVSRFNQNLKRLLHFFLSLCFFYFLHPCSIERGSPRSRLIRSDRSLTEKEKALASVEWEVLYVLASETKTLAIPLPGHQYDISSHHRESKSYSYKKVGPDAIQDIPGSFQKFFF